MSQHGRRRAAPAPVVDDEPARRFGFLTMESALVLGIVALIVLGSFLVHAAFPSKQETETVIGDKKVRITTVGKGGVLPGPVQPRVVPVVAPTPVPAAVTTTKPRKPKPAATVAPLPTPTPTPTNGGGNGPLPGGGGGGGGGGGNNECTVLIFCKPGQKPAPTPTPAPAAPTPTPQAPSPQQPPQVPPQ